MQLGHVVSATLVAAMGFVGLVIAQEPSPGIGAGWTGISAPKGVIEARRGLMSEIERLMRPIDTFASGEPAMADSAQLQTTALTISWMLSATPHLFPPTTNPYDPTALEPPTSALPLIWRDFDRFFALAESAEVAASTMATTTGAEPLRAAARNLRASCDTCHALYLKSYVAPQARPEDFEFDFESVLPN
jgi:cytochrome c556